MENYNITLEEAKQSLFYSFYCVDLGDLRNNVINGTVSQIYGTSNVVAMLQLGNVDIELTICNENDLAYIFCQV